MINLQNIDAMGVSSMPTNYAKLCITSPPYNMNLRIRNGQYCSRQIVKEISSKYDDFDDNMPMNYYRAYHTTVLENLIRVCDTVFYNVQFLTGNKRALYAMIGHFGNNIKEFIVWDKVNAEPAIGTGVLNSRWEALLILQKPEKAMSRKFESCNFKRGELQNLWQIKRGKKIHKDHGAVFPVELVEKIILNFSNEGDLIIDPFMGTGTTGVACKMHNRNFTGFDKSKKYFDFASERIAATDFKQPTQQG